MRFLVAWDGSELGTLALRATIHVLSRPGDQLLVYHVRNPGRYGALDEFEFDNLQKRLAEELEGARGLHILSQQKSGEMDEALIDAVFDACDLEGEGRLCQEEIRMALSGLGLQAKGPCAESLTRAEFHALARELESNGSKATLVVPFALRGLRLGQLQTISNACGCGQLDGWLANECRQLSENGQVKEDLYALDRFFVRPATAGQDKADAAFSIPAQVLERALIPGRPVHSVSFAQLMNGTGLRCDFFVSHSWSHPFTKTLVALNSCAKRCTGDTKKIAFWICLFALNQHDLKGELAGCELARMPFAYGLSKSKQGVVMVLDARVEPFRRIWCLYEVQRAWELAKDLRLITDCAEGASTEEELEVSGQFALTVAEELQSISAFDARSSDLQDKINIWHKIMNGSVKAAFPVHIFRTRFEMEVCNIHGFGKAWFTEFDAGVCRLLATPVFHFSLSKADLKVALRYLGLGAQCSPDDLAHLSSCIVAADLPPLHEVWVQNPSCGHCQLTHVYAHFGSSDLLECLLRAQADPQQQTQDVKFRQPLHFAAKAGHLHCTKLLLRFGAHAHCSDKNGETPLQIAAYGGHSPVLEELLQSKAWVNSADRDCWTPLICAARAGHEAVVKLLIEHKANLKAVDSLGRSALKHAQLAHHERAAARLARAKELDSDEALLEEEEEAEAEPDFLMQSLGLQRESQPEEVDYSSTNGQLLMTVHQKEKAEAIKISRMIVNFAARSSADVLVMGSTGRKETGSLNFQRTTLGSSAHLAALEAPCTVVLIRPGCRVDPKLATVFMVAVDGSFHSRYALQISTEWARPDKDEIVCRVFGPPEFTESVERLCTDQLQAVMRDKKVEYAVIPTELDETADVHGDDLSDTAQQCRFRQQAFLVFGARGRNSEGGADPSSPVSASEPGSPAADAPTTLGHVARWCIKEAQCSLIIARPKLWKSPTGLVIWRASSLP
ncbi:ANK1 [Symbiodinium natans]|uniref:ANK1 protein n=1 Tax=Symbiodinium natans TaxID=878477 RepID=A0A812NGG7_9DINO|nr:ANK1 [Symbiodinium natans]